MEYKLNGLQPEKVFKYFEEISRIPHGSRDTKRISDYCVEFAKERNLRYIQDESNNVIIFKDATSGYENSPHVILQGHLDMVCEKTSDSNHNFDEDPLCLIVDGDNLKADNTTLGGDDGIAVAYALAILDSDDLEHAGLEVVFTVDEEIGMLGADSIDLTPLQGKYMLNMDSDEEGIILASCAGGVTSTINLDVNYIKKDGLKVDIKIDGLLGGHSGAEINKGRANANCLLGRLLFNIMEEIDANIISLYGGTKDNAIPRESGVSLVIDESDSSVLVDICNELQKALSKEYGVADKNIKITVTQGEIGEYSALNNTSQLKLVFLLVNLPNGIMAMSQDIEGLVETSLNLGILSLNEANATMGFAVRSSIDTAKVALKNKVRFMAEFVGAEYTESGDYPEWAYKRESKLREVCNNVFKKQYGYDAKIEAIHAGLECGIISSKIPDIDIVSFGPNMKDIHTPNERLSISSTKRVWDFVVEVLKELK